MRGFSAQNATVLRRLSRCGPSEGISGGGSLSTPPGTLLERIGCSGTGAEVIRHGLRVRRAFVMAACRVLSGGETDCGGGVGVGGLLNWCGDGIFWCPEEE